MVIDTSAVVAILKEEPDYQVLVEAAVGAARRAMSAATFVELAAVVSRHRLLAGPHGPAQRLLKAWHTEIIPVTAEQANAAADAYRLYGRGSGHPARLNFGDCFSYALAATLDEPLLFTGEDFAHTDIRIALRP